MSDWGCPLAPRACCIADESLSCYWEMLLLMFPSFRLAVTSKGSICLLYTQNGGKPDSPEEEDPVKRYIRNSRDLSRTVVTDTINT